MDPRQSNVGEDSQGQFPGGNIGSYQPGWNNPYMYGYHGPPSYQGPPPPGWLPQGFQPHPPYVGMMNPTGYAPEGYRQPDIPDASVQRSEEDMVEVPTPTSKKRNKHGVTRTKLGNFSPDEDKNLVKSWLEISCDPITRQKGDRMWERIIQRYNSRRASNPEKKKANSGAGPTSSAEYAARMQDLSLQKFFIMQEEAVRKNDRFQQLASINEKCFEEMRRHNEALLQIEQEEIRLMREEQDERIKEEKRRRIKEEKKEDERILAVDLNACAPPLRLYYQTLQEEILEKIAARRRRSQAP